MTTTAASSSATVPAATEPTPESEPAPAPAPADHPLAALLAESPEPERLVRRALALLEADFRELALVALADWAAVGHAAPELFGAVGALQRPSWGSWNGLLGALRSARRNALRSARADVRARVEKATVLARVLAALDGGVAPDLIDAVGPLADLLRQRVKRRARLAQVLALPIALRNRVVHDAPDDADWWRRAADALAPLLAFHAEHRPTAASIAGAPRPAPWFLERDGARWTFNGLADDLAVAYVSPAGKSELIAESSHALLTALQRLLGRADAQEKDFRALLGKLAPEEIRGILLGDFLVGRPVGEGGFAVVHRARQLSTGRLVALKILHDGLGEDVVARFAQEAAFLARVDHPNVVRVIGSGEHTWSAPRHVDAGDEEWIARFRRTAPVKHFIAMEWVEGRTLEQVFGAPERPAQADVTRWFIQAASALGAVHGAGLIHRDVKPGNLMVTPEGEVKLMDFGIARSREETRTLVTTTGHAIGTPAYMSPEQIRAADADSEIGPATDIYSLCAAFYELFTGARIYDHDTEPPRTVETRKLGGELPAAPRRFAAGLAWEIETILMGGLQPEVADRYPSMGALEADLRRFAADEPIAYRRPSPWRRALLVYRRHRLVANLVALFFVLAVAGVAVYIHDVTAERALAEKNEEEARRQATLAARNEAEATRQAEQARLAEQEALRQEDFSSRRAKVAEKALKLLVYQVNSKLDGLPGERIREARAELLREAHAGIQALAEIDAENSPDTLTLAEAHYQVGELARDAGLIAEAERAFARSSDVCARLVDKDRRDVATRQTWARSLERYGAMRRLRGDLPEADAALQGAQDLVVELIEEPGGDRSPTNIKISITVLTTRGKVVDERGEPTEAQRMYETAIAMLARFLVHAPEDAHVRTALAAALHSLGDIHKRQNRLDAARELFEKSLDVRRRLRAEDPQNWIHRLGVCDAVMGIAGIDSGLGRYEVGRAGFDEAIEVARGILAEDPNHGSTQKRLSDALVQRGVIEIAFGRPEAAIPMMDEAVAMMRGIVEANEDDIHHLGRLGFALSWQASARMQSGDPKGAVEPLAEARAIFGLLHEADETNTAHAKELIECISRMAILRSTLGDKQGALEAIDEGLALARPMAKTDALDLQLKTSLIEMLYERITNLREGRGVLDLKACEELLATFEPDMVLFERMVSPHLWALKWASEARLQLDEPDQAVAHLRRAEKMYRERVEKAPRLAENLEFIRPRLREAELIAGDRAPETSEDHLAIAQQHWKRERHVAAVAAYEKAFADPADMTLSDCHNAAQCAAQAMAKAEPADAARYRELALRWLAFAVKDSVDYIAELEAKIAAAPTEQERAKTQERLARIRGQLEWVRDTDEDLAPLRGLPEFRALFDRGAR